MMPFENRIRLIHESMESEEHGNLTFELIEELMELPDRKLARQVWLLITCTSPTESHMEQRIRDLANLFIGSECQDDMINLFRMFVELNWNQLSKTIPAVKELDSL